MAASEGKCWHKSFPLAGTSIQKSQKTEFDKSLVPNSNDAVIKLQSLDICTLLVFNAWLKEVTVFIKK